jgi:hypothetical protein
VNERAELLAVIGITADQSPQSLMALENSPPNVTPNAFDDWLVAIAHALTIRR